MEQATSKRRRITAIGVLLYAVVTLAVLFWLAPLTVYEGAAVSISLAAPAYGLIRAAHIRAGVAPAASYRSRKRWSLFILVVALPVYIVTAVTIVSNLTPDLVTGRPPILLELAIYIGLGVLWVFPLKRVFLGIGQADPDAPPDNRS